MFLTKGVGSNSSKPKGGVVILQNQEKKTALVVVGGGEKKTTDAGKWRPEKSGKIRTGRGRTEIVPNLPWQRSGGKSSAEKPFS